MNEDRKNMFELRDETREQFTSLISKLITDMAKQPINEVNPELLTVINTSVSIILKN